MKRIYFDYAATTPVDKEVLGSMLPYLSHPPASGFGNPSSLHSYGQEAMAIIDDSREKIAKLIGADFREIIFTSSATEANNLALRGIVRACGSYFQKTPSFPPARKTRLDPSVSLAPLRGAPCPLDLRDTFSNNFRKPCIIVSAIEHESILETCRDLQKEGVEIIYLPVDKQGVIDLRKLKESLNERTILVSVMYANNEIGTIQPISEISKIIKSFRAERSYPLFHTDAVQAFQFLDCDVNKLGVDLMTLSAHKIYGPKGIGALYIKSQNKKLINPIVTGGGQEFGFRSGTENVASIVGFAKAAELVSKNREKEIKRITELSNYFWKRLKNYSKIKLNGAVENKKLPNILNVQFPGQNADDLLIKLDLSGIAVSSGAACSSRAMKPSYVLKAIGLTDKNIKNSLRFSFGKFTDKKEIDQALKILKNIFKS